VNKQASWRTPLRAGIASGAVLSALLVAVAILVRHEPQFYRQLPEAADEALARRAVSKAAAWHAGFSRPGEWDAATTDAEVNAWLAIDLPRNHSRWLPPGVSRPRLAFRPGHVALATRVSRGPLTAVVSCDLEIQLRDVNQIAIVMDQASLGAIPLPRAAVLRALARRIGRVGMVTDLRVLDGRTTLMVYIPSTHDAGGTSHWLKTLAIGDGELLMAGETRSAAAVVPGPAPRSSSSLTPVSDGFLTRF